MANVEVVYSDPKIVLELDVDEMQYLYSALLDSRPLKLDRDTVFLALADALEDHGFDGFDPSEHSRSTE